MEKFNADFTGAVATNCRKSIVKMVANAASGHPGGSLSCIDFLTVLYSYFLGDQPIVISNGHISPAVYAILAEAGVVSRTRVIENFRKPNDIFEGHVNRDIPGIFFGTGPLGVGVSAATGFALAEKMKKSGKNVYFLMGDGEADEGQIWEMMHFAAKFKLGNLVGFVDKNNVQLSGSTDEICKIDVAGHFRAAGWRVFEIDGHDHGKIFEVLGKIEAEKTEMPTVIIGKTEMGRGVSEMENTGSKWHGKAPKKDEAEKMVAELDEKRAKFATTDGEIAEFFGKIDFGVKNEEKVKINAGVPRIYEKNTEIDCRTAYGNALLDLARENDEILAFSCDVSSSTKTDLLGAEFPTRHIECGIAEQQMVSAAGGISLAGFVPFVSTFGAFLSARAKDQIRVNDINRTNVKMVATHCGLSVGEDGPTHQILDDIGAMNGLFHTKILEPCDPNQCDRMIRKIATENGNFYVRMGRAKAPVICDEKNVPIFIKKFEIGKATRVREGSDVTVLATGPMVWRAVKVADELRGKVGVRVIAVSSLRPFDGEIVKKAAAETGKIITIEDQNPDVGLGAITATTLADAGIAVNLVRMGVKKYQLSGTDEQLYALAGISGEDLKKVILEN